MGIRSASVLKIPQVNQKDKIERAIRNAAQLTGIDKELIQAQIYQESRYDPDARAPAPSHAVGLMQIQPGAARDLGLTVNDSKDDRLDIYRNVMAGSKYLKDQLNSFGNIKDALYAYHDGPGAVASVVAGDRSLSDNARIYVTRIARYYAQLKGSEQSASSMYPELYEAASIATQDAGFKSGYLAPDAASNESTYETYDIYSGNLIEDIDIDTLAGGLDKLPPEARIPGAMKIGDVWLYVPPTQISIVEYNPHYEFKTLRTQSKPKIKTGKQEIRIEIQAYFVDVQDINEKLRPLLAQFKMTPFLPMENEYVESVIMPRVLYQGEEQDVVEDIPPTASLDSIDEQGIATQNISSDPLLHDTTNWGDGAIPDTPAQPDATDVVPSLDRRTTINVDLTPPNLEDEIKKNLYQSRLEKARQADFDLQLAVSLDTIAIQTVPGFPQSIMATMSFSLFNYRPYTRSMMYVRTQEDAKKQLEYFQQKAIKSPRELLETRNVEISPTTNISESQVFKDYYQSILHISEDDLKLGTHAKKKNLLYETNADDMQKIVIRGWRTRKSISELIVQNRLKIQKRLDEIQSLTTIFSGGDAPSQVGGPIGGTRAILKSFWSGVLDNISVISSVFPNAMDAIAIRAGLKKGRKVTLSDGRTIREETIYVQSPWPGEDKYRLVPIDRFFDPIIKDAESSKFGDLTETDVKSLLQRAFSIAEAIIDQDLNIMNNNFGDSRSALGLVDFEVPLYGPYTQITGISANYANHLVHIPVLDYNIPTAQHMGGADWTVTINLQTTDLALVQRLRFLSMASNHTRVIKNQLAAAERTSKLRKDALYEDIALDIISPGVSGKTSLLHVLGIEKMIVHTASYSTVPEKPGLYSVTLELIESNIDLTNYESLFIFSGLSDAEIDAIIEHLRDTDEPVYGKWKWWRSHLRELEAQGIDELTRARERELQSSVRSPKKRIVSSIASVLASHSINPNQLDMNLSIGEQALDDVSASSNPNKLPDKDADKQLSLTDTARLAMIIHNVRQDIAVLAGSGPSAVRDLNMQSIIDKYERILQSDKGQLHLCYPDLNLPVFTDSILDTPADFYFHRGEILNSNVIESAEAVFNHSRQYMEELKRIHGVNISDDATRPEYSVKQAIQAAIGKRVQYLTELQNRFIALRAETDVTDIDRLDEIDTALEKIDTERAAYLAKINAKGFSGISSAISKATEADVLAHQWGTWLPDSQKNVEEIFEDSISYMAEMDKVDTTLHVARAFPTFKLYFIEEDNRALHLFDDVYSYAAVEAIDVIKSRKSASATAVVRVSNITETLTDPILAGSYAQSERNERDTSSEKTVNSLLLRVGTHVVIKMGYSNNPDDLPIVFQGAITELTPGDVVEFVAQSWGAELNEEIFEPLHFRWKLLTDNSFGHVVASILKQVGELNHYGLKTPFNYEDKSQPDRLTPVERILKGLVENTVLDPLKTYFYDPRFENIYLKFGDTYYTNRQGHQSEATFSWWVYNQTAWDAIQEVLLWHPNFIVCSRPYNEHNMKKQRSTLYIGPRDGYYKWTDDYDAFSSSTEEDIYTKELTALRVRRRQGILHVTLENLRSDFKDLYPPEVFPSTWAYWYSHRDSTGDSDTQERLDKKLQKVLHDEIREIEGERDSFEYDTKKASGLTRNPQDFLGKPEYKPVTRTHFIDSTHHIVSNTIQANAGQGFYNKVLLGFPEDEPVKYEGAGGLGQGLTPLKSGKLSRLLPWNWTDPQQTIYFHCHLDDNIPAEYTKTYYSYQKNIDSSAWERIKAATGFDISKGMETKVSIGSDIAIERELRKQREEKEARKKALGIQDDPWVPNFVTIANGVLANTLREMYTGELTIIGDPTIQEHDRVFLYDQYNSMWGAIDVEEVHHHFSSSDGYITIIRPDLFVRQRDFSQLIRSHWFQQLGALSVLSTGGLGGITVGGAVGLTALFGFTGPIGLGLAATAGTYVFFKHAGSMLMKFAGWRWGRQAELTMCPLWWQGKPYTAGTEGMRRDDFWVHTMDKIQASVRAVGDIFNAKTGQVFHIGADLNDT